MGVSEVSDTSEKQGVSVDIAVCGYRGLTPQRSKACLWVSRQLEHCTGRLGAPQGQGGMSGCQEDPGDKQGPTVLQYVG